MYIIYDPQVVTFQIADDVVK